MKLRKLYFLLPGTTEKFYCGGLFAELKTLQIAQQICECEVVTYRQREADKLFLDDILAQSEKFDLHQKIFVVSWGFDVNRLINKLHSQNVIYHAHSAGYGFSIPARIPIITVSRNTMGYWGQMAPHSLIYYLPNQISDGFQNLQQQRDIDVLVHARKSSTYLMNQLIPALQAKCNVMVISGFVDDLAVLFNRAKVYLYDSAEYWLQQGVSEGFGLQPLEAIACGCQIFSSVNGGLSDYLDPGFNCQKIAGYSCEFDVTRILQTVSNPGYQFAPDQLLAEYRRENILNRLRVILTELNLFFDHKQIYPANIPDLTPARVWQLKTRKFWQKFSKKIGI